LSIDAQTGVISGTPTTAGVPTTYTVTGSNSAASVTAQLTIDVNTAVIGEWLPTDYMNQARYRTLRRRLSERPGAGGGRTRQKRAVLRRAIRSFGYWRKPQSEPSKAIHTGSLLPTGQVPRGGDSGDPSDPQPNCTMRLAGTWTPTSSMSQARDSHTATLLSTGMVLVAAVRGTTGTRYPRLNCMTLPQARGRRLQPDSGALLLHRHAPV